MVLPSFFSCVDGAFKNESYTTRDRAPQVMLSDTPALLCLAEQCIISEYEKSLQFDEKCLSVMLAEWEANSLICPVCTK